MGSKRKRSQSHHAKEAEVQQQSKPALPPLPEIEAAPFTLVDDAVTTTTIAVLPAPFREPEKADEGEWEIARPTKKAKKEKFGKKKNYPEFVVSPQKLKDSVKLKDLQGLVLWLTSNAPAPQWLLVRVCSPCTPLLSLKLMMGSINQRFEESSASWSRD